MTAHWFDLAALDALLGDQGFVSVLNHDAATGLERYATLNCDRLDNDTKARVTASYALGLPGRGRRIYNLLALDVQVQDGVVLGARTMGHLAPAAPLAKALMPLALSLANGVLPNREQLAAFLPVQLLDALENNLSAAAFPDKGTDREETLPESLWGQPSVFCRGQIDPLALADTLNLAVGERAEMVDVDPASGDYRVFHLGAAATPSGGETLTFELHRQGPGFERRLFNVLSLTLGARGPDGACPVEAFACDAGAGPEDLPHLLPRLARIASALQRRQRPEDALVLSFLSKPAQALWMQTLMGGGDA